MNPNNNDVWLGAGVVTFGVFLLVYAIPVFVASPSNVRIIFLSPTFWPAIISWFIVVLGATLVLTRMFGPPVVASEAATAADMSREEKIFAVARLVAIAVIMAGLVALTPVLGLVLASGIAFALISAIVMTPRPITALIVAILLPLVLFAFFAHIAGVSIPQGRLLTLP